MNRNETLYFWYSPGQKQVSKSIGLPDIYYKNDKEQDLVEYTECSNKPYPFGLWSDYRYIGKGTWDSIIVR